MPAVKVGPICALVGAGGTVVDEDTGEAGALPVCGVTAFPETLTTGAVPLLIPEMLPEILADAGLGGAEIVAGRVTVAAIVLPSVRVELIAD